MKMSPPAHGSPPDTDQARAIAERDGHEDGRFVFAVLTTGIYCLPSCPSRRPKLENIRIFSKPVAAEAAGFRACLRCRPWRDQPQPAGSELTARAVEQLEAYHAAMPEAPLSLASLAEACGVSPSHLHRTFKATLGLTPREYAEALRQRNLRRALANADSTADAIFAAGYGSVGRGYAAAGQALGTTPARYRRGGRGMHVTYTIVPSALGPLLVAATEHGVCAVIPGDDETGLPDELRAAFPKADLHRDDDALAGWAHQAAAAASGAGDAGHLPMVVRATAFQWKVWKALAAIPSGQTRTYGQIAADIGVPGAARAVGNACAANLIAGAIPCHRAVSASPNGPVRYRWGPKRKARLQTLERAARSGTDNLPDENG